MSYHIISKTMLHFLAIGTTEIILIVLAIVLLFGGKKIPELMKGIGKGMRSFKEGMNEIDNDIKDTPKKASAQKEESANEQPKNDKQ